MDGNSVELLIEQAEKYVFAGCSDQPGVSFHCISIVMAGGGQLALLVLGGDMIVESMLEESLIVELNEILQRAIGDLVCLYFNIGNSDSQVV